MATLISFLFGLLLGAVVLHVSVKVVAADSTPKTGFGTAVVANLIMMVGGALLGSIPIIGLLLSVAMWFVVVMKAYAIGAGRAFIVGLVYVFIVGGLMFVLATFFGVALFSMAGLLAIFA
ncbi:MAG: hypothetical protein ABIJ09_16180 [Pseudomonadota bacterium]